MCINTKSFAKIADHIVPNSLIIIDLDNTLFNYESRCAIQTDKLIEQTTDPELLNTLIPQINNLEGFGKLQLVTKWSESKIIYLTARTRSQQIATRIILSIYKIVYPVLYAGSIPKGEYLLNSYIKLDKFNKIIFVDDLDKNLESVLQIQAKIPVPIQTFKFT